jgi:peptide/nickel transport system permease protein
MLEYFLKRILWMIPVMLGVIIIVFSIAFYMPGDPVEMILGAGYTQEEYDAKAEELGLDKSFIEQLGNYLYGLVTRGDLGISYQTGRPVTKELQGRIWVSIKIGILSCLLTTLLSVPLGIITAVRQNTIFDYSVTTVAVFLASVPGFWIALMFIILFSQKLGWLPASGLSSWKHYILPVVCNGLSPIAITARMTRSSMLEVINQDYVRTARSKGLKERSVILGHALKNALIPVITVVGAQFSMIIGGSVITEMIFNINGMGARMVTAINNRDYQMILSVTIILSAFTMVVLLLVDLLYAAVDPRIKAEFSRFGSKKKKRKAVPTASGGGDAA